MINANESLDKFIELIRELEVIPRDRFFKIRIKHYISKLRKSYKKALFKKHKFTVTDILNFTVLLNTIENMSLINSLDIDNGDVKLYTKIHQTDILYTGVWICLEVYDKGKINTVFIISTANGRDITLNAALEFHHEDIADYGSECDKIVKHTLTGVYDISENISQYYDRNSNLEDTAFKMLLNIFSLYYDYIFDELERKYIYENKKD